jgi:hypothetical protein
MARHRRCRTKADGQGGEDLIPTFGMIKQTVRETPGLTSSPSMKR